jgi:hypothetical protein
MTNGDAEKAELEARREANLARNIAGLFRYSHWQDEVGETLDRFPGRRSGSVQSAQGQCGAPGLRSIMPSCILSGRRSSLPGISWP